MIASEDDVYRKPASTMFKYWVEKLNGGVKPDPAHSFYIGDAAGRAAGILDPLVRLCSVLRPCRSLEARRQEGLQLLRSQVRPQHWPALPYPGGVLPRRACRSVNPYSPSAARLTHSPLQLNSSGAQSIPSR